MEQARGKGDDDFMDSKVRPRETRLEENSEGSVKLMGSVVHWRLVFLHGQLRNTRS